MQQSFRPRVSGVETSNLVNMIYDSMGTWKSIPSTGIYVNVFQMYIDFQIFSEL